VSASDALSLVLTAVFGIVSTVGVAYQIVDMRRRHRPTPAPPPAAYGLPPLAYGPPPLAYGPPPLAYGPPRIVVRVRLLLLVLTALAIPNAGVWVFAAVARDETADSLRDPVTWIALVIAFLILSVPFAVVPTVLSVFIGRGRSVARVTAVVLLTSQGLCRGLIGAAFPAGVAVGAESGSGSTTLDLTLGGSLLVVALISVIAAIMLVLPSSNAYFRAMGVAV
jgi:hypothetical protein